MPNDSFREWPRCSGTTDAAIDPIADTQDPATNGDSSYFVEALTHRELVVLRAVALGLSNEEVAAQLAMTRDGVKYHLKNIYSKLGAARRTDAIRIAIGCGFLTQPRPAFRHHVVAASRSQFARSQSAA